MDETIPQPTGASLVIGVVTPILSAALRNSKWESGVKAFFTNAVVAVISIGYALLDGSLAKSEVVQMGWAYGVTCMLEPQMRSNILKRIDEATTGWYEQWKQKNAKQAKLAEQMVIQSQNASTTVDIDLLTAAILAKINEKAEEKTEKATTQSGTMS